jgi:Genetic competence transcription factor
MKYNEINYLYYDLSKGLTYICGNNFQHQMRSKPLELINYFCLCQASTVEGRIAAVRNILRIVQKPPVYIQEDLFLFPTVSSRAFDCIWLNHCNIRKMRSKLDNETAIHFKDGEILVLTLDYRILRKQMMRCNAYLKFLDQQTTIELIHN